MELKEHERRHLEQMYPYKVADELNKEERALVEKLAEQPHFKNAEKVENQNILERMKSFFRG
mgnify:CR=1 FL=1